MIKKTAIIICALCLYSCRNDDNNVAVMQVSVNNLIQSVIKEIYNNYASNITKKQLENGAIKGMLAELDEHSIYISQEDYQTYYQSTRGNYFGLGIETQHTNNGIEIISVIEDSPAFNAGIKTGDVITKINEVNVATQRAKSNNILLNSNNLKFTILRDKNLETVIQLKKTLVQLKSVKLTFIDKIAFLKITCFNDNTVQSVTSAITTIKKQKSIGLIIDLRGNPGGIIEQAIGVANLFLQNSIIAYIQSRNKDDNKTISSEGVDIFDGKPIAILIDKNTASGAEILAAALSDNKRAIVIGERSYGKGSLQTIIQIPGKGAIKLTTAYIYTPNGSKLDKNGVLPNILATNQSPEKITQRAVDLIKGLIAVSSSNVKTINLL